MSTQSGQMVVMDKYLFVSGRLSWHGQHGQIVYGYVSLQGEASVIEVLGGVKDANF